MSLLLPLLVTLYAWWYAWHYPLRVKMDEFPDFRMIYEAARGNFQWKPTNPAPTLDTLGFELYQWSYPDYLAAIWKPLAALSWERACVVWNGICLCAVFFLSYLLMELDYGWIALLAFAKPMAFCTRTGNAGIGFLCLAVLGPVGACIAALHKPYFFVFVAYHLFKDYAGVCLRAIAGG